MVDMVLKPDPNSDMTKLLQKQISEIVTMAVKSNAAKARMSIQEYLKLIREYDPLTNKVPYEIEEHDV